MAPAETDSKKLNSLDPVNPFSVSVPDAGEIALMDDVTKKIFKILKTG